MKLGIRRAIVFTAASAAVLTILACGGSGGSQPPSPPSGSTAWMVFSSLSNSNPVTRFRAVSEQGTAPVDLGVPTGESIAEGPVAGTGRDAYALTEAANNQVSLVHFTMSATPGLTEVRRVPLPEAGAVTYFDVYAGPGQDNVYCLVQMYGGGRILTYYWTPFTSPPVWRLIEGANGRDMQTPTIGNDGGITVIWQQDGTLWTRNLERATQPFQMQDSARNPIQGYAPNFADDVLYFVRGPRIAPEAIVNGRPNGSVLDNQSEVVPSPGRVDVLAASSSGLAYSVTDADGVPSRIYYRFGGTANYRIVDQSADAFYLYLHDILLSP